MDNASIECGKLIDAIKQRIAVSEQEATKYARRGDKSLVDYHAGCQGMGLCILEDIEALRGVRDGRREEPAKDDEITGRARYLLNRRHEGMDDDWVSRVVDVLEDLVAAPSERSDE